MSYNGSGTFQINTSGQPVVTGTVISSSAFNALTADLATGLSTAITKDGQTATTVRIPFAQGINSSLATDSTSTSTGSIITAGGVGIAKALYVGTTANIAGTATVDTITSKAATALTLKSAGTTAVTLDISQNATFAGTLTTAAKGIAAASLPAGAVLQVVSTTKTDTFSTSSTSFVDITGLSVSITPISSSNKVFVTVDVTGQGQAGTSIAAFRLVRDSTVIDAGAAASARTLGFAAALPVDNNCSITQGANFLDSPSSTSSVTYKVQVTVRGGTAYVNRTTADGDDPAIVRTASTITVMEIAA
jgi:hypothetical protein